MIKVYKKTKVYVYCPAGVVSGGAELLHQLVHYLRNNNIDAYIVYYGSKEHKLPDDYKVYNVAITEDIEDLHENIEVFIENEFDWVKRYKYTQKFLWWISVDNFYLYSLRYLPIHDIASYSLKLACETFIRKIGYLIIKHKNMFKNTVSINSLSRMDLMSGYQSEYAQNFLQKNGFKEIVALKDYINTDYIKNFSIENKEDIILYNPKKMGKFINTIIKRTPNLNWIPIKNLSRSQVVELIRKAKIYVDFGYHPGKDRLPRECAASGCCVITGSRGSAAFFEDVPIPNKYKFDENKASINDVITRIKDTLDNYYTCIDDFKYYRYCIMQEKEEFEKQIKNIFLI